MKKLLFLLLLIISIAQANAQVVVDRNFKFISFENKWQYFVDSSNTLGIADLIENQSKYPFSSINTAALNTNLETNAVWVCIKIQNKIGENTPMNIVLSHPFISKLDVYAVNHKAVIKHAYSIYETKESVGFLRNWSMPTFKFNLLSEDETRIFIRIKTAHSGVIVIAGLSNEQTFYDKFTYEQILYSGFFGIIIAFGVLALVFFAISRSSIYLYYGLYVIFMAIGFQSIIGNLYLLFDFKINFLNGYSGQDFYWAIAMTANILFVKKLFEIPKSAKIYNAVSNGLLVFSAYLIFITVTDLYPVLNKLNSVLNIFTLFSSIAIFNIIYGFIYNRRTFYLYIISFSPILIVLSLRILSNLSIIDTPVNFAYIVLPVLTFEFLILLIGLGKIFLDNLKQKNILESKIIITQIETQESERKRIAIDLHDDLGSTLSVLKEKISTEMKNSESNLLIDRIIQDLRSISHNLLPIDFETFGFIPSLEKHIAQLNENGLKITFISFGERRDFTNNIELNIYRILIEILHNIKKHSQSKAATVQLIYHKTHLYVSVEEEGLKKINQKGIGIGEKAITSRLEYLHANVLENGNGQNGYSYIFEVPYDQNPNR